MPNLDHLYSPNERFHAFERHEHGLLVSLAGPGTGKTHSLLKRAAALGAAGVSHDAICYLTFIKEIADAFVADYIDEFGEEQYAAQGPRISTLHSFACRLVRNLGFQVGYDGELYFDNIADSRTDTADTALTDLLRYVQRPGCTTVPQIRHHLSLVKKAWRDNDDPAGLSNPIPTILPRMLDVMRAFRLIDWDQTIPMAHELLSHADPLPDWIGQISHYFVDEFQDFNQAEQAFILQLAKHALSTVIVGDDDQSLFSGRGGSPAGIRALYSATEHDQISLVKCFRCREAILEAANVFQAHMREDPHPMVRHKDGGSIVAYRFKSSKAEIAYLATLLTSYVEQMADPPSPKHGTACLFPNWRLLDFYYENLAPIVPCIKRKLEANPNRVWLERVLHLLRRPGQRFLQRLLLNRVEGIQPRHRRAIVDRVVERDCDLPTAIESLLADGTLKNEVAQHCRVFAEFLQDAASQALPSMAAHLAPTLGVDPGQIAAGLELYAQQLDLQEIDNLVSISADRIYPESAQPPENPKSILFLTMHGSKGLTKRNVVIPGLEAAWLPGADESQDIAEKKRLYYVAITRATDSVIITYPLNRAPGDPMNYETPGRKQVSPFVTASGVAVAYHE